MCGAKPTRRPIICTPRTSMKRHRYINKIEANYVPSEKKALFPSFFPNQIIYIYFFLIVLKSQSNILNPSFSSSIALERPLLPLARGTFWLQRYTNNSKMATDTTAPAPISTCCLSGAIHSHSTPRGREETIGGLQCYVSDGDGDGNSQTNSREKSVVIVSDSMLI